MSFIYRFIKWFIINTSTYFGLVWNRPQAINTTVLEHHPAVPPVAPLSPNSSTCPVCLSPVAPPGQQHLSLLPTVLTARVMEEGELPGLEGNVTFPEVRESIHIYISENIRNKSYESITHNAKPKMTNYEYMQSMNYTVYNGWERVWTFKSGLYFAITIDSKIVSEDDFQPNPLCWNYHETKDD